MHLNSVGIPFGLALHTGHLYRHGRVGHGRLRGAVGLGQPRLSPLDLGISSTWLCPLSYTAVPHSPALLLQEAGMGPAAATR